MICLMDVVCVSVPVWMMWSIINLSSCFKKLWHIIVHICQVYRVCRTTFYVLMHVFIKQISFPLKITNFCFIHLKNHICCTWYNPLKTASSGVIPLFQKPFFFLQNLNLLFAKGKGCKAIIYIHKLWICERNIFPQLLNAVFRNCSLDLVTHTADCC